MTAVQGAHLVGSINAHDTESAMRAAAGILGDHLRRLPDGEVGRRSQWVVFQADILGAVPGLERIGGAPLMIREDVDARQVRIVEGADAEKIDLPPLGYAAAAIESYAVFRRLRSEGVVGSATRFQVSLPTPVGVVAGFFQGADRRRIEPVYAAAMHRELEAIVEGIPSQDLAVQWDVASEFAVLEDAGYDFALTGGFDGWFEDRRDDILRRVADLVDAVPDEAEVGIHLCYGDAGEKHFTEPTDASTLVDVANGVVARASRALTWVHLPVPIERDDPSYFAPLAELRLPAATELYLGLVHREDGIEGARRRAAAAARVVAEFGVSTECGMGRAPRVDTDDLLRAHRGVSSEW
jgi:hypothetical protein